MVVNGIVSGVGWGSMRLQVTRHRLPDVLGGTVRQCPRLQLYRPTSEKCTRNFEPNSQA